ncbi:hypothetical protein HYDPIDRAFT_22878 [Hydnomerulius pinastri MD-312]|nr:hypothetical protein HYDPIDRAFT_22878 [Hydnomerulius pinastri MD-312]
MDRTDDNNEGGIVDLSLRADIKPVSSGDEYIEETPAEKRLRLAKIYLESLIVYGRQPEMNSMQENSTNSSSQPDSNKVSRKAHLPAADHYDFTPKPLNCVSEAPTLRHPALATEDARFLFTSKDGSVHK